VYLTNSILSSLTLLPSHSLPYHRALSADPRSLRFLHNRTLLSFSSAVFFFFFDSFKATNSPDVPVQHAPARGALLHLLCARWEFMVRHEIPLWRVLFWYNYRIGEGEREKGTSAERWCAATPLSCKV
jgi:hypothetical protein